MKLEVTALVAGVIVGTLLALIMGGDVRGQGAGTDLKGNVNLGLEDRSLR